LILSLLPLALTRDPRRSDFSLPLDPSKILFTGRIQDVPWFVIELFKDVPLFQRGTPPIAGDISLGAEFGARAVQTAEEILRNKRGPSNGGRCRMIVKQKGEIKSIPMPRPADIKRKEIDIDRLQLAMELA
jgi:hypothetical protein